MIPQPIQTRTPKVIALTGNQKLKVVKKTPEMASPHLPGYIDSMAIATRGKIEMIVFSEIVYVEAESNYTRFYLKDRGMIFASKTLKEVSYRLERAGFIRVHKSFMLHLSRVQEYDMAHGWLLLRSGEKIPVSRSHRKLVLEKLLT